MLPQNARPYNIQFMTTAEEYREQEALSADRRHSPIVEAYLRGMTHAEIAEAVGVTRSRVTQILCRARQRGLITEDKRQG